MNIPGRIFENCSALNNLRIENNGTTDIHIDAFKGLANLKLLSLRKNLIQTLDKEFFASLTEILEIELSENQLKILPADFILNQK